MREASRQLDAESTVATNYLKCQTVALRRHRVDVMGDIQMSALAVERVSDARLFGVGAEFAGSELEF